jgi:hypothetical protein
MPEFASPSIPRRFGRFELRPSERVVLADGTPVAMGARAFDLLAAFVDRPGRLITKDDLLATVGQGCRRRTTSRYRSPRCARSLGRLRLPPYRGAAIDSIWT